MTALIKRVCVGDDGALKYTLVGLDGVRRCVETRAVPLARGAEAGFSALAVTLDLTEGTSRDPGRQEPEEWAAERDRLTQAAEVADDERRRLREELRTSLWDTWRLQQTHQAEEWATERDKLKAALHAAEAGREGSAEGWAAERDRLTQTAEAAEGERHRLNQRRDELDKALRQAQTQQQTQAEEWAAEWDKLKAAVHAVEDRWQQLAEETGLQREQMTHALQDAVNVLRTSSLPKSES